MAGWASHRRHGAGLPVPPHPFAGILVSSGERLPQRDESMSSVPDLTLRHLAKVVESSDDAIVSKDLSSVIVTWNRAAERMFGYPAGEAVGQASRMISPADRQDEEDRLLGEIKAGRAVTHFETVRQRKDGSLVDISLTVSPIYDDAGVVIGASKIARDISTQKRAVAAMQRLAAVVGSAEVAHDINTLE